jgi:RNA polymerase sigma-70 factor (sigma-E family)
VPAWRRAPFSRPPEGLKQPGAVAVHLACVSATDDGVTMRAEHSPWVMAGLAPTHQVDLADLYAAHYRNLVGLAALLLGNASRAEDVAQDAFVKFATRRVRLREPDLAVGYLRSVVINDCRALHRRGAMIARHERRLTAVRDEASAEESALSAFGRDELVRSLRALPARRREVVVLRYYCDMSEVAVADVLGISVGTVKSTASRGLAELAASMGGRS